MRDAARLKAGFFPISNQALDHVLKAIELEAPADSHIIDTCAGEGEALLHLATALEIPAANTWAIELDRARGESLAAKLPEGNVLTPASFFGCSIKANAFSLVYCNPPFDDLGGGMRVEQAFFNTAIDLVAPGGLFIGVFTERVVNDYLKNPIMSYCERVAIEPLPAEHRPYGEVFVVGRRREQIVDYRKIDWNWMRSCTIRPRSFRVEPSTGPLAGRWPKWAKVAPTNDELYELMQRSPLRKHLDPPTVVEAMPRPPLALSKGHLALMLASGYLNGLVEPDGEPPHVVRGTASKVEELAEVDEDEGEHQTKTTSIYRERIQLTVRAVAADGEIKTFCS